MYFKDYLGIRESVREYDEKAIEKEILDELLDYSKTLEKTYANSGCSFVFFEKGAEIYEQLKNIGGYSGVMIKSSSYFGVRMIDENPKTIIMAAYMMQALIKKAFELKLGTCWVDINHIPQSLAIEIAGGIDNVVNYLFAVGHPAKEGFFEGKTRLSQKTGINKFDIERLLKGSGSSKLSIEETVFLNNFGNTVDLEMLEQWGLDELFLYIRYAPSHYNIQPWRFIVDNDKIQLCIINPEDKANLTDAGIVMYLFEGLANEIGMKQKWDIEISDVKEYRGIKYLVVGTFDM